MEGLTRLIDGLTEPYSRQAAVLFEQVGGLLEEAADLASGLMRSVGGLLGGLLGERAPNPGNNPLTPPAAPVPAAPAPPAPVGPSPSGGSFVSGTGSSGTGEDFLKEFGVLAASSCVLMQGGELSWPSREPLGLGSAMRMAVERPG